MPRRRIRRPRGAQPGNQNARKHGFYSRFRTREDLEAIPKAAEVNGLDEDILVLRVKIRSILAHDPKNTKVLCYAFRRLERLLKTREKLADSIKKTGTRYSAKSLRQFLDRLNEENDQTVQDPA